MAARAVRSTIAAPGDDERRRACRRHCRKRALRPREGCVHRCAVRSDRLLRAGRRRHAVPRRDREHAGAAAGRSCCACCRPARCSGSDRRGSRFVNVRVLSATNADLAAEIAAGRFREDVLYRLNTVVIHLPPLRERREDIAPLAAHFLAHYSARYRKRLEGFTPRRGRRAARHIAGPATFASSDTASSARC